jgi:SAM-dependent methyltransferase
MVDLGRAHTGLSAERLSRLGEIEGGHFWFVGRRALFDDLFQRHARELADPVLDLGCGTGRMLRRPLLRGRRAVGVDLVAEGLRAAGRTRPGPALVQASALPLPFADGTFGAVLLLDVLEHVDDRAVLREVLRVLRPGGSVLISVPACPWLWSHRDVAAGHLRRYRRRELRALLAELRLRVLELRYYQCLLFPLALVSRLLGRRGPRLRDLEDRPRPALNALLARVNRLEVRWGRSVSWPWGSSLVAVCRKGGAWSGVST